MMTDSASTKSSPLPPSLVPNLQSVLAVRRGDGGGDDDDDDDAKPGEEEPQAAPSSSAIAAEESGDGSKKPVVLVTNGDRIGSPGLATLVEALVRGSQCDVYVCAPELLSVVLTRDQIVAITFCTRVLYIAGAREALLDGVPSVAISLNWRKG